LIISFTKRVFTTLIHNARAEHHSDRFRKIPKGFLEAGLVCATSRLPVSAARGRATTYSTNIICKTA